MIKRIIKFFIPDIINKKLLDELGEKFIELHEYKMNLIFNEIVKNLKNNG